MLKPVKNKCRLDRIFCPTCGYMFRRVDRFCPCGQEIDWSVDADGKHYTTAIVSETRNGLLIWDGHTYIPVKELTA